jgi:hypothetical protein
MLTNIGTVKKTEGQIKKHHTQLTDNEKCRLKDKMIGLTLTLSDHAKDKPFLNLKHIESCVRRFTVIEFNHVFGKNDNRVLIRSKESFIMNDGKFYNVCLVISLDKARIITVYYNLDNDKHETLDVRRYRNFNILNFI